MEGRILIATASYWVTSSTFALELDTCNTIKRFSNSPLNSLKIPQYQLRMFHQHTLGETLDSAYPMYVVKGLTRQPTTSLGLGHLD